MSQAPFQKFTAKKKNSVIKEEFRQEKKKYRKERNAFFDQKKEEEYKARIAKRNGMATKAADNAKGKPAEEIKATGTRTTPRFKQTGGAEKTVTKSAKATAANDNHQVV